MPKGMTDEELEEFCRRMAEKEGKTSDVADVQAWLDYVNRVGIKGEAASMAQWEALELGRLRFYDLLQSSGVGFVTGIRMGRPFVTFTDLMTGRFMDYSAAYSRLSFVGMSLPDYDTFFKQRFGYLPAPW